ncbi:aminotransferase class I/II-fold pyridoxal phosphate-dependent enzyme [Lacimicrobium alkaliphilum]|uniref:8-amino-7-oxononanoate synthase n=1 Tax=Lacimicrobium alkaliphilum TaxID=1526571 RepID=A0ABQ1QZP0_9ALTE|nr:8-amino-7-oxononanoate synthase [Lacimicrobium alkaliphilum]GGD52987.1 8-amino-7-oxononanoate synthase [Lacimicrobium alkaliphilum]
MSFQFIAADLAARTARHLYRRQHLIEQSEAGRVKIDGHWYYNFSSNDYLGLAQSQALRQAACDAAQHTHSGSTASPLVTGYTVSHQRLEDYLCQRLGRDRVLLFNSGFSANQAVIQTLMRHGGQILADKLSHASMLDGALASQARLKRFAHNDVAHLSRLIQKDAEDTLIMTEGVFSMDGDKAPVQDIVELASEANALLLLDDAHGFGVLGQSGAGTIEAGKLSQLALPLLMGTFGKAVATSGAFVALSTQLYEYLINFARHYIYSTSMSPLMAEVTLASLKLVHKDQWRRDKLTENIQLFREQAISEGLPVSFSDTAIQPVAIGRSDKTLKVAEYARSQGFWVGAMRAPTVPEGSARLRVTLSSIHEQDEIRQLIRALAKGLKDVC